MSAVTKLGSDALIYGVGDLVGKLILFATFPFLAAALSPRAFGALELVLTATTLLGCIVNCGLNNSVQRFYWDPHTTRLMQPPLVTTGMLLLVAFGTAAAAVGLTGLPVFLSAAQRAELPLGSVALVAALLLLPAQQWLQYLLDVTRLHFAPYRFLALTLLWRGVGAVVVVWVVVRWNTGVDGVLATQFGATAAVIPFALWAIRKDIVPVFERGWATRLISFGYPFIFAGGAYWIFGSTDRWMLATLSSVEETGTYSLAYRIASVPLFVSAAFARAWSPFAIKLSADDPGRYRTTYASILLTLLVVMLAVGGALALFSGELVGVIMPPQYAASAPPLAILCFGIVLQSTQLVTSSGISIARRTVLLARLAWMAAALNVAANWILVPQFGATGAAWATTLSYLFLTASYLYYTQRVHPLPIKWAHLLWILLLGTCVAVVSLVANTTSLRPGIIIGKGAFAILCIALVLPVVPWKDLKRA